MIKQTKTREEQYSGCFFQWVKTERIGDVCRFKEFINIDGVEYVVFTDNTRIVSNLIGDVVLMFENENQLLSFEEVNNLNFTDISHQSIKPSSQEFVQQSFSSDNSVINDSKVNNLSSDSSESNPVSVILEKSKKKVEKINITLTVKIPSPDLYFIIKNNFDDVDAIILDNVINQVQEKQLRDAIKKELLNIYNKKKKN